MNAGARTVINILAIICLAGVSDPGQAQHRSGHQDIIDDIIRDVVDRAFAKFEDKIAEANETYDEKREKIMSKERGG